MKPVQLDYVGTLSFYRHSIGLVALCMALALSTYLVHRYAGLSERVEVLQTQLQKSERQKVGLANSNDTAAITPALRSEVEQSNRVIRQLGLPWDELFSTIESIPHDYVAVLSIQPDVEGGTVTITAEAESAADIAGYIEAINESGVLKDAHLINHQVKTQDTQKPVGFTLIGTWVEVAKPNNPADAMNH